MMRTSLLRLSITLIAITLSTLTFADEAMDFSPFTQSMKGLKEIYYVKKALNGKTHQGNAVALSTNQCKKMIKSAGSSLSIQYTTQVKDFVDFYTASHHSGETEIMFGIADHYLPRIEEILINKGLPTDLKYLPLALSSMNYKNVSDWGASGFWQIMYTNGKLYNLKIDSYLDERRDPIKSTHSAVAYLKDLYDIYLDWELAIAAYTSGPSNINKAIRRAGGSKKITDLYPHLPKETRNYLSAYVALMILHKNMHSANLTPLKIEVPYEGSEVEINEKLHIEQVSKVLQVDIDLLRVMNPQYKSDIIPAGRKNYLLVLPTELNEQFAGLKDSIYNYNDSVYFVNIKRDVVSDKAPSTKSSTKSSSSSSSTPTVTYSTKGKTKLTYTVKSGDNLGYISDWYDVSVAEIKYWNNIHGNMIKVGQKLVIYKKNSVAAKYKNIDKMSFDQKEKKSTASTTKKKTTTKKSTSNKGKYTWYTVKSGDSPYTIAQKYPGVSADDILEFNNIKDPRNLKVGQKLKIPVK